ncbi:MULTISPECIES: flavin reductase family protein [unclassified Microbacterium]|uniref:flavin reductase family protein n=1 Tax=unclassified Microbacterium TaxID=2609290 RepID=UPI00214CB91D|nr:MULTISPECIES: flavin reductase family protein [unclassified Microbacterium]MCR2810532.1 flavin reductase family protein [Microbacterium sp. zg.B185]WIM19518.1 flavin reductase family protein [Microbacterium sp. zg-B185]
MIAEPLESTVDAGMFRDVMGHYPTGVIWVAGIVDGVPVGMIIGSFNSVSLEPPLVSFMPQKASSTYPTLRRADRIAISILAHEQVAETRTLAGKDPDRFARVAWSPAANGAPVLDGAVATIQGRIAQEVEAGDHWITLVHVDDLEVTRPVAPLLFFQGGYGGFSPTGLSAHLDGSLITAGRIAEAARPQLDRLAEELECHVVAMVKISASEQTIGASAFARSASSEAEEERLGSRIPIVPPLGEAAIAWDDAAIDAWVSRLWPPDRQVSDSYRRSAEKVRAQGYTVKRTEGYAAQDHALSLALQEYARSELSPARDRAVRGILAASRPLFIQSIAPEETAIELTSITVPVFEPAGGAPRNSGIVLRASGFPRATDGSTALGWVAALQSAAAEVRETLRTSAALDYQRYVGAGLRDR